MKGATIIRGSKIMKSINFNFVYALFLHTLPIRLYNMYRRTLCKTWSQYTVRTEGYPIHGGSFDDLVAWNSRGMSRCWSLCAVGRRSRRSITTSEAELSWAVKGQDCGWWITVQKLYLAYRTVERDAHLCRKAASLQRSFGNHPPGKFCTLVGWHEGSE